MPTIDKRSSDPKAYERLASLRGAAPGRADDLARAGLVRDIFGIDPRRDDRDQDSRPAWLAFARFGPSGACVATLEAAILDLVLDGRPATATAIRHVVVDPAWRGLGLFRTLMLEALAWCEQAPGPTLLYTEDAALYERFGFCSMPQYRFSGVAPKRPKRDAAMPIDSAGARDWLLPRIEGRAPVSRRCGLIGAASLVLDNLVAAEDLELAYAADLEAILAYEITDRAIMLVDIVAPAIPTMAEILARLPARTAVVTSFAPDLLDWSGTPFRHDTGLMIRGEPPPAMLLPFMLPPTAEF